MKQFKNFMINEINTFKNPQNILLSFQHCLSAFGGTILIPIIMFINSSVGLFSAGIATLLYACATKGKVPIFLGSSAVFIAPVLAISQSMGQGYAIGGLIGAAFTYLVLALITKLIGYEKIKLIFPSFVTGTIIIIIAITLVPVALSMCKDNYALALVSSLLMIIFCSSKNKYINRFPVLLTIAISYIIAYYMGLINFHSISTAPWVALPAFVKPHYNIIAISIMSLYGCVSFLEHIGEFSANSIVTKQDHFKNVGLHKSLVGDALGLTIASITGGTPSICYGENTSIIAITKNTNPTLIRGAAVIAILLSLFGKFGAILQLLPLPVVGGLSFVIFGMIFMSGMTTIKESNINIMDFRYASVIFLPIFIGTASLISDNPLKIVVNSHLTLEGLSLAALVGIGLNAFYLLKEKLIKE